MQVGQERPGPRANGVTVDFVRDLSFLKQVVRALLYDIRL